MKKSILTSLALLSLFAACNDDYNDQFNIENEITDVKNIVMTLAPSDYAEIAGNATNKEIALAKDPEEQTGVVALEAVGKKKYFTADATAEEYLPAYLASKYPQADLNSKFTVTYNQYQAPATYLSDFTNISSYTFSSADYETVWGDKVEAPFLTPASVSNIPEILSQKVSGATEGDMVVVKYAYSETEPSIGGAKVPVVYKQVTDFSGAGNYVLAALADDGNYYPFGKLKEKSYGYGYMYPKTITVTEGIITEADGKEQVIAIEETESGYALKNAWEQYLYLDGSYNSYNVSTSLPAEGGDWSITPNTDGTFSVVNVAKGKHVKLNLYTGSYSYGCYPTTSFAGTTYLSATFADADNTGGFEAKDVLLPEGSTYVWKLDSYGYYKASAYVGGNKPSESYLVSPAIDLSKASAPQLSFDVAINYLKNKTITDYINVVVSTDYAGDVTTATWTALEVPSWPVGSSWIWNNSGAVDLSAYKGETVYVAFKYTSTSEAAGTLEIKNLVVEDAPKANYWNIALFQEMTEDEVVTVSTRAVDENGCNAAALYRYDGSAWVLYTNNDAQVAVVEPSVYASVGASSLKEEQVPLYLNDKYPYALEGDRAVVVYNQSSSKIVAVEYTKQAAAWVVTPESVVETLTFTLDKDGISAKISVYLNESLLGSDGGFVTQDIMLTGGLSYVWTNTTNYGWKASSFLNSKNNQAESWLVSSALNFRKGTAPTLTFDEAINFIQDADKNAYCAVKISTDYKDDVTKATWTKLELPTRADGASWNFVNVGEIDLSAYVGSSVRIAFVYLVPAESPVGPTWEFKNILVKEKDAE